MVSNDYYNKSFNTVLVMPISSSKKYVEEKFAWSNAFQTVTETQKSKVQGTILCQHIRSVDLLHRSNLEVVDKVTTEMKERLSEITKHFFWSWLFINQVIRKEALMGHSTIKLFFDSPEVATFPWTC